MQQYSSLPEQNSEIDAKLSLVGTVEALRFELLLERYLNHIQTSLNDCLRKTLSCNQNPTELENNILQTTVNEVNRALKTSRIAIATRDSKTNVCKIDFVSPSLAQSSKRRFLGILNSPREKLRLVWGQTIDVKYILKFESQDEPCAWRINDSAGDVVGWLIFATAPVRSAYMSTRVYQAHLIRKFLAQVAQCCSNVSIQLENIQSLQQHCQVLENTNQNLERTNQLKNQFLANTSHEIRTPLSSILGFTQLMLVEGFNPTKERQHEYLSIIQSSGKHLLGLINDILDLSKIEANQLEIQRETVDVGTLCLNVMALVKEKASNRGLKLRLSCDSKIVNIIADPLRLKQMLLNLLFNALKFTNSGSVGLDVKLKDEYLYFIVWDTGTGIPKELQAELFQPYFQIPNSVVSREEGTGLGLALTRKLAELHGGWIEMESEVNRGSRFTIVIPYETPLDVELVQLRDETSNEKSLISTFRSPVYEGKFPDILLVEDDQLNALMIKTYFEELGYQVTVAKNAIDMWNLLKGINVDSLPSIILMDVFLPDANGLELVKLLRLNNQFNSIPIIAQTAMAMKGDREICLTAGFDDYISKPIDLSVLGLMVLKYVRSRLS